MVNRIHLGRRTPANKLEVLQHDDGVWDAAELIAGFLAGRPVARLTHGDFAEFLTGRFKEVVITPQPVTYEYVYNPVLERWERICHSSASIAMRNDIGEDAIVLALDDCATYS